MLHSSLFPPPAIYLCKRTMQNKARLELADYEAVSTLSFLVKQLPGSSQFIFFIVQGPCLRKTKELKQSLLYAMPESILPKSHYLIMDLYDLSKVSFLL